MFALPMLLVAAAAAAATAAPDVSLPAVVQLDLVFPRNQSYTMTSIFPIVFTVQNFELLPELLPLMAVLIHKEDEGDSPVKSLYLDFESTKMSNFTGEDHLYFAALDIHPYLSSEGKWTIAWSLGTTNCSEDSRRPGYVRQGQSGTLEPKVITFTTSKDDGHLQLPDLVTQESAGGDCFKSQDQDDGSVAFNITGRLPISGQLRHSFDGKDSCLVVSNEGFGPKTNHCAAKVNQAAATELSAALLARACAADPASPNCPVDSAGRMTRVPHIFLAPAAALAFLAMLY